VLVNAAVSTVTAASLRPIAALVASLPSLRVPAQQAPAQALHPVHQRLPQPPLQVVERLAKMEPVVDLKATLVVQENAAVNMATVAQQATTVVLAASLPSAPVVAPVAQEALLRRAQ